MSLIGIDGLPVAIGLTGSEYVPLSQAGVVKRAQLSLLAQIAAAVSLPAAIEFLIDGSGSNIAARTWGYLKVPFDATIVSAELLADATGSIIVDVWKCTYAQFDAGATHPVVGDKITASTPPRLSSATKSLDETLTSWTTTLDESDVLAFNVPSSSTGSITRVTLSLNLTRVVS